MYEVARRSAAFAAATGGLLLVGVGCASADSIVQVATAGGAPSASVSSSGPDAAAAGAGGVLSGNALAVPLSIPIGLCDIAVLGTSGAESCSAADTPDAAAASSSASASAATGVLSGNVVQAPASVPLSISGLSVLGNSAGLDSFYADDDVAAADDGCSCAADGVLTGNTAQESADETSEMSDALWADELQMQSSPEPSGGARSDDLRTSPVLSGAPKDVRHSDVADTAPAAQRAIAQAAAPTETPVTRNTTIQAATPAAATSSITLNPTPSVPRQRPAASSKGAAVAKRILKPARESSGRLAETGSSATLPLCAGGAAALVSGASLSAHAAKAKAVSGS